MFAGISNPSRLNQENPQIAQNQVEAPQEATADLVKGKVNPVESPDKLPDEPDLNEETDSQRVLKRRSQEQHIIDLMA